MVASAATTIPGVQNPHCTAPWRASASARSSPSRPGAVRTSAPSHTTAATRHEATSRPSSTTEHDPHSPCSQAPVTWVPPASRRARSRLSPSSGARATGCPSTVSDTSPSIAADSSRELLVRCRLRLEGRSYAHRLYGGRVPMTPAGKPSSKAGTAEHPDRSAWEKPGFLLWHATLRWQRMVGVALKPTGLTHVQFVLLASAWFLEDRTGPPSQRELAEHAGTDAMMTSQVLRSLEASGLVERHPDPSDARIKRLTVTAEGRAAAARPPSTRSTPSTRCSSGPPATATTSSGSCAPSPAATPTAPRSTDRPAGRSLRRRRRCGCPTRAPGARGGGARRRPASCARRRGPCARGPRPRRGGSPWPRPGR